MRKFLKEKLYKIQLQFLSCWKVVAAWELLVIPLIIYAHLATKWDVFVKRISAHFSPSSVLTERPPGSSAIYQSVWGFIWTFCCSQKIHKVAAVFQLINPRHGLWQFGSVLIFSKFVSFFQKRISLLSRMNTSTSLPTWQ